MGGVARRAFVGVEDFEILECLGELAWVQTEARERLAGAGDVDDGQDDAAGDDAAFRGLEEVALEVIAHGDEIPGIAVDDVFVVFEVGDAGIDFGITCGEEGDCRGRPVDGGNSPAAIGEPHGVAAGSAGEIQSAPGSDPTGNVDEQRRGGANVTLRAIAFLPTVKVHRDWPCRDGVYHGWVKEICDLIAGGMRSWMAVFLMLVPCARAAGMGETLFRQHCAPCHGAKGDGGRGANLAVRRLPRAPDDATLGAIIAQGIPGTEMPQTRMTDPERAELIAYVRSLGRSQAAQVAGDAAKGGQLFWGKANCGTCHTAGPRGGRVGPDLTNIGERRSQANLRQSLLDPEAETPENFAQYRKVIYMPDNYLRVRVVMPDGKQISGARVDEDTFTIQILDDASRIYSFRKSELKELHKDWGKSPMPSYRGALSEAELVDVIAYLSSLTGAP